MFNHKPQNWVKIVQLLQIGPWDCLVAPFIVFLEGLICFAKREVCRRWSIAQTLQLGGLIFAVLEVDEVDEAERVVFPPLYGIISDSLSLHGLKDSKQ